MSLKIKITLVISAAFILIILLTGYVFFLLIQNTSQKEINTEAIQICNDAVYAVEKNIASDTNILRAISRMDMESGNSSLDSKISRIQDIVSLFDYEYVLLIVGNEYYRITKDGYTSRAPDLEIGGFEAMNSSQPEKVSYGRIYGEESDGLLIAVSYISYKSGLQYQLILKKQVGSVLMDLLFTEGLKQENIVVSTLNGQVLYPHQFVNMKVDMPERMPQSSLDWVALSGPESRQNLYATHIAMEDAPFIVTSYVEQTDVAAKIHKYMMSFGLVASGSVVLIAILVFFLVKYMIRAITGLAQFVACSACVDAIPEIYTKRKDEAGVIARAFSSLLHNLQKTLEEKEYAAFHDNLTGLPNRYSLDKDIAEILSGGQPFAFALMDIDNFKTVNDQLGHLQGDKLLFAFACLLREFGEQTLKAYRWGGDEFGIVIHGQTDGEYQRVCENILANTAAGFMEYAPVKISVSLGACICPQQAGTQNEMLRKADKALVKAKKDGKNRYCFYQPKYSGNLTQRPAADL